MNPSTLRQLEKAKEKVAALEAQIAKAMRSDMALLPARYGFKSVSSFIAAMKAVGSDALRQGTKAVKSRRTRAKITDATRAQVKKLVEAGKTGVQIVEEVGISLPSVQNIKKALGLVTPRKAKRGTK